MHINVLVHKRVQWGNNISYMNLKSNGMSQHPLLKLLNSLPVIEKPSKYHDFEKMKQNIISMLIWQQQDNYTL